MENHAHSTENSEDMKRQIDELKNVCELVIFAKSMIPDCM